MTLEQQFQSAILHHQAGRLREAADLYSAILAQHGDHPHVLHNSGVLAAQVGRPEVAAQLVRRAISMEPNHFEFHHSLANVLQELGQRKEALASFRSAIRLNPGCASAHAGAAKILSEFGQYDDALASAVAAICLEPENPDFQTIHGLVQSSLGNSENAVASFRKALKIDPANRIAHSDLLFELSHLPNTDPDEIFREHRAWADRHASQSQPQIAYGNDRSPDRRLRVGYVSADFRQHPVGFFFAPLLNHHNHNRFEIYCYSNVGSPDSLTKGMESHCDKWRNIRNVSDDVAAEMIRSDGIDILVDLSGHSLDNRLPLFSRKPAPIQVTYLGYPNTTGMTAIDYRLTDALADPVGMTDRFNVEKLVRLPTCAWCYQPGDDAPDIVPVRTGPIRFGCFNAFLKINDPLIDIWARLLKRVPESELLLKSAGAGQASSRDRIHAAFARHGIATNRIHLRDRTPDPHEHLRAYNEIDVALDTFPYHGTTTTCEALWMGVPVVTLAGQTHASRVGISLLVNAGLPALVGNSAEQYVSIAADISQNRGDLQKLRGDLREQLRNSPLLDGRRFAGDVEDAFRMMWMRWCHSSPGFFAAGSGSSAGEGNS